MEYEKEDLLRMYENLVRGRLFIERLNRAVGEGIIRTSFHSALGQEAIDVGILSAMKETDWYVPNHRSQAGIIMRMDPRGFMAEIFGKREGLFKGVAYDYHMADLSDGVRVVPNSAVLGGQAPTAAGFAFGRKLQNKDEVVVATYGDGNASEGATYEAYNLASLFKVPVVFAIINNEWAMTVPLKRQTTNPNICERAVPFGLPVRIADGNDILEVRQAMEWALKLAREGRPCVVEFKTLRITDHFIGQGGDYRQDKEKVEDYIKNRDCVSLFEGYLIRRGLVAEEETSSLKERIAAEYEQMARELAQSEPASFEDVFRKENIYAEPKTGGEL